MKNTLRKSIRPAALSIAAPVAGFLLVFLIEIALKIEIPKLLSALINLLVVAPIAFIAFPRGLGIPFGKVETREFLQKVGFFWPEKGWQHLLLGLILAGCTLIGMWAASVFTGKYTVDVRTINLPQLVFSLNPALWEELFSRGVLMIWLLKMGRSLKQATVIQVALFGLVHIKGLDLWAMVDAFSVAIMALGFTYTAHKTNTLLAGIVFHYFHDALLFLVQLPDGTYTGVSENILFYCLLWLMVGAGCGVTKFTSDRLGLHADTGLYRFENIPASGR